ncbi:RmuC domain protein [Ancylostoma ceylanicum]|uniref:RmuC domain protein n=1 Tax=Ancylostoma ceylanicum TaxID=53326 RepID=A0A0D6L5E9_9BILA|nr:RmuC domain protein [Ancylostoma ceylanicum]
MLRNRTNLYNAPVIYANETYRYGGLGTQRGFNEEELYATAQTTFSAEYRFLVDRNSFAFLFFDQSWYENNAEAYYKDAPYGFGAETRMIIRKYSKHQSKADSVASLLQAEEAKRLQNEVLMENVRLQTQIIALQERIEQNQSNFTAQEKSLKEQLELMAKSFVQQGTQQLKVENELHLQQLLKPFQENLLTFRKEVQEQKEKGIEQYSSMREMIGNLHKQHTEMHSTAQNLVDALRGEQKMQGDWGEFSLERILETSGLEKGIDYKTQDSFRDESGRHQRPDVVVYLPDNKHIIIDSKVSMNLAKHILSVKNHIRLLGDKNYSDLEGISSPDFVLLFIPLESSFALAIKEEPAIYEQALAKKVVLVTPSTLLATLKTVSSIWKHEKQTKNAIEIAEQAARLYDKFVGFIDDMEKIGQKQLDAQKAYSDAMNKLSEGKGNLIRSSEKLKELGVKSRKDIDKKYLEE